MRIAIIGGGIGGLCTALALVRAGFEPEVFEQAPALLEVGAAIAVWPNAMRVLQRLGCGEEVLKRAGVIKQVRWLNYDGRNFRHVNFPETDAPAVALHRADLQRILLQAVPEKLVRLGKKFESYSEEDGTLRASFADGTSISCDVLIGADGLHSRARELALKDGPPIFRGYTVWRGITPFTPGELKPATAMEIFGRGRRFGIGPVGLGRTGWWATANEPEEAAEDSSEHQSKLMSLFDGWYAPVLELIRGTPSTSILRNSTYDRTPVKKWTDGNVILIGDAVHPTTPNLGQGGCMAIEDAAILAGCLSKGEDINRALRNFVGIRAARTAAITRYSLRYGAIGQTESPRAIRLRDRVLSMMPERLSQKLLRLIFDYDTGALIG
jgi:2-polyprenyl-6-methoxyphenol hydroxylase-like FAD-dependent oxidoreductase